MSKKYNKHGYTNHPLYAKRRDMINRCYNPNVDRYEHYGGKGVRICDEWLKNAKNFIDWSLENGWKKGMSIERIDIEKDYSPENCKYITMQEQHYNKSNTKYIFFKGQKYCFAEFVKRHFKENYTKAYFCIWGNMKRMKTDVLSEKEFSKYNLRYNKKELQKG